GRVYLPSDDIRRFGSENFDDLPRDRAGALIASEAERAATWFDRGLALVEQLDRRSASCVLAMTGIYRCILGRIALEPTTVLDRRVSLPTWEKAWVAARSMSGREVKAGFGGGARGGTSGAEVSAASARAS